MESLENGLQPHSVALYLRDELYTLTFANFSRKLHDIQKQFVRRGNKIRRLMKIIQHIGRFRVAAISPANFFYHFWPPPTIGCQGCARFWWILAVLHRASVNATIVMFWKKQSRCSEFAQKSANRAHPWKNLDPSLLYCRQYIQKPAGVEELR